LKPEEVCVLLTTQAKSHDNWHEFQQRLGSGWNLRAVDIPDGRTEDELWEVFDRINQTIVSGDEIVFDITHAFRSLGIIALVAASYVRTARDVNLEAILYGAYEARDDNGFVPVFDLTLFAELIDWLTATDAFVTRSDSRSLAEKLKEAHSRAYQQEESGDLPKKLQKVADLIGDYSYAFLRARPLDVLRATDTLVPLLAQVSTEVEQWAKPFGLMLRKVTDEVEPLAHSSPEQLDSENLRKQFHIIQALLAKGHSFQAVALAREWVVNWCALERKEQAWLQRENREAISAALNCALLRTRGMQADIPEWLDSMPDCRELGQLWGWLADLRNDLAHCGMRTHAAGRASIEKRAAQLPDKLRPLLDELSSA
jgi:CRISPR-associated DxTHG motif protein